MMSPFWINGRPNPLRQRFHLTFWKGRVLEVRTMAWWLLSLCGTQIVYWLGEHVFCQREGPPGESTSSCLSAHQYRSCIRKIKSQTSFVWRWEHISTCCALNKLCQAGTHTLEQWKSNLHIASKQRTTVSTSLFYSQPNDERCSVQKQMDIRSSCIDFKLKVTKSDNDGLLDTWNAWNTIILPVNKVLQTLISSLLWAALNGRC